MYPRGSLGRLPRRLVRRLIGYICMALLVVLAAVALGMAHVAPPADCTPSSSTGSFMVALLSLDLYDEPVFIASSIQCLSLNAVDSPASVVVTAVQGNGQTWSSGFRHSPAPLFEVQSAALDGFDAPAVISAFNRNFSSPFIHCVSVAVATTSDTPGAQLQAWSCGVMQVLPSSTGRRSASGAIISGPILTRLPDTTSITAMAYMAAVYVCCTWARDTITVASQVHGSYNWNIRCLECSANAPQDQHLSVQVAGDLTMTQSHLTVLPRSSLAVDSSVFHIPSSGMGGYWHSSGVRFQGGAFDYNIHSIVDASVSVATSDAHPTATHTHISRSNV